MFMMGFLLLSVIFYAWAVAAVAAVAFVVRMLMGVE